MILQPAWASIMASATPLLFLGDAKAPNCRKNKWFKDLGNYYEWPKVVDAVIKAPACLFALLCHVPVPLSRNQRRAIYRCL